MKWRTYIPTYGDKRLRTRFLYLPKRIGEDVRWLERASWIETYEGQEFGWFSTAWLPEDTTYEAWKQALVDEANRISEALCQEFNIDPELWP